MSENTDYLRDVWVSAGSDTTTNSFYNTTIAPQYRISQHKKKVVKECPSCECLFVCNNDCDRKAKRHCICDKCVMGDKSVCEIKIIRSGKH